MWAAWSGSLAIADLLIVHGADPNAENVRGETAMHWAAAAGHLGVCQYLLEQGGGDDCWMEVLHHPDHSGRTPWDYAQLYQRFDVLDWMRQTIFSAIRSSDSLVWA
jgi:ankyrin repeat protein